MNNHFCPPPKQNGQGQPQGRSRDPCAAASLTPSLIDLTTTTPDAFPAFLYGFPTGTVLPGTRATFSQPGLIAMPFGALSPGAVGMGLFSAPGQYPPVTPDAVSPGFARDVGLFSTPGQYLPFTPDAVSPGFARDVGHEHTPMFDSIPVSHAAMGEFRPSMPSREAWTAVSFHSRQPLPPPAPSSTTTSTSRNMSSTAGGRPSMSTTASTTRASFVPSPSLARCGPQQPKQSFYSGTGFSPPNSTYWLPTASSGEQTLSVDEVSSLIQHHTNPQFPPSDWARQNWDKMLLENADDVVHVLSLKGQFLYLSPACKRVLEYDPAELVGMSLSEVCHPSDIVPVTRELKEVGVGGRVDVAFRIRRKERGYLWWESWGVLHADPPGAAPGGKGVGAGGGGPGKKYLVMVGRRRPVLSLRRRDVLPDQPVGGEREIWSKLSTGGMILYMSGAVTGLLDLVPRELEGTSLKDLMRKESQEEFRQAVEKARKGMIVGLRHEVLHKRGRLVPAQTVLYPGEADKPSFLIAVTRLVKEGDAVGAGREESMSGVVMSNPPLAPGAITAGLATAVTFRGATEDDENDEGGDIFAELRPSRCTSWQYELRQMEKVNRLLAEELTQLITRKEKRKRRKGGGAGFSAGAGAGAVRDCANCHKRDTPEWRRGPSGNRDLCNRCGLRWAKSQSITMTHHYDNNNNNNNNNNTPLIKAAS